jgi:ubiquinone/menaquinone biosynthesis C-methylase UbiE
MNWHTRYAQQANWTRDLRSYIFEQTGLRNAKRVLEAGCGTGAVLSELPEGPEAYGLDLDLPSLRECRLHAPRARRVQGNVLRLPFPDRSFELVYSHFLLLWVKDPYQALQEMKRVARKSGFVIAFAEPDYLQRIDRPAELMPLGRWQTEALQRQGADAGLGARLAELFFDAGIRIVETGTIQNGDTQVSLQEWELEWEVIESDLRGSVPASDLQRMKELDQTAREKGGRVLQVPTYFAWGRV